MRIATMQGLVTMRMAWVVTAVAVCGYAREARRRQVAEARAERLSATGAVDLEPIVEATEDMVAAVRRSGARCRRSADVVAIPAQP